MILILRRFKQAMVAMCLFLVPVTSAVANEIHDLDRALKNSSDVVVGTVTETEARLEKDRSGDQLIITRSKVTVEKNLKGRAPSSVIEITSIGGKVGDLEMGESHAAPLPKKGDRSLFILRDNGIERRPVGESGVLRLDGDKIRNSNLTIDSIKTKISGIRR
jgi:hypothetical protein